MKLVTIKISDTKLSATNVKGRTAGKSFEELVSSIKEKGVLSPILVREQLKGKTVMYEVIAGNRRLAAAKSAGLKEIPAQLVEMTDIEAREAQIVENLQREDIHPLEEAEALIQLIKTTDDFKILAAKLGKSEGYIRNRIMLCNLADEIKKSYREAALNDGQALEISRLSPTGDQQKAITHVKQNQSWGGKILSVKDLKSWIDQTFFDELSFQPWLKSKEAMAAVGPCHECPKETSTLFGEVKEGACTTSRCHSRKMKKYIEWMKEQTPGLVLVSKEEYGGHKAGVLGEYDYKKVAKEAKNAKPALIVAGKDRGKLISVQVTKMPVGQMTPEEKVKHEEEVKKEKIESDKRRAAEKEKENRKMEGALKNITWPLKEKHLEPLLDIVLENSNEAAEVADRLKLEAKRDEDGDIEDVEKALRDYFIKADARTKLQIIFELGLRGAWGDLEAKIIKKL